MQKKCIVSLKIYTADKNFTRPSVAAVVTNFNSVCAPRSFPDSLTCIVTPKNILRHKPNVIFFTVAPYVLFFFLFL